MNGLNKITELMLEKKKSIFKVSILIIIVIALVILSGASKQLDLYKAEKNEDNKNNAPGQAQGYKNSFTVDEYGKIKSGETVQDIWDEMVEEADNSSVNFDIRDYLDNAGELAKLINAEVITQNLDMRSSEEKKKEIDWEKVNDPTNKDVQGIIQLKRSDSNEKVQDLEYMDPTLFNGYVNEYKNTGSEKVKEIIRTHFTIGKKIIVEDKKEDEKEEDKKEDEKEEDKKIKYSWPSSFEKTSETFLKNKEGIKIEAPGQSIVMAWDTGKVTEKTDNKIVINHTDNVHITEYYNLEANVKINDTVTKGQIIGKVKGDAKSEELSYLEFKIKEDEKYVNPNMFEYINKEHSDVLCWPLPSAVSGYNYGITSTFGDRPSLQTDDGNWTNTFHGGIDIWTGEDKTIVAAEDGIVEEAYYSSSWGNNVYIKHNETYGTRYAHLEKWLVNIGDTVVKGQPIGIMGKTGGTTGAHLHFEVYENGERIDPFWFNYASLDGEEILITENHRYPEVTPVEGVVIGAKGRVW